MSDDNVITPAKLFDWMERKFERIDDRMAESEKRFDKLELVTSATLEQTTETNGRVTSLEGWQRQHIDHHLEEEREEDNAGSYAAGRKSVRDGDRALVRKALSWLGSKWPIAVVAVLAGFGARVAAWFLGGNW